MKKPTVVLSGIAKRYGKVEAVKNVSFTLNEGETVALVGHNGAGKTTLIKLMLGLIRPSGGSISVMGEDPAAGDVAVRKKLGYLPESVAFHAALTGRETIAFYARLKHVGPSNSLELLERVGLGAAAADRPVRTYSKGMRQRLGLAQALLGEPRLLLLDEPTSGLDPALRRRFYDLLSELRSKGTTILLSSHALTELEDRADRLLIVNKGVSVADGTLDDLRGLARLPTRVSVKFAAGATVRSFTNGRAAWRATEDGRLEADVAMEDKIALLKEVTTCPDDIADLQVTEPTLDDLYAHFLGAGKITS
ncbi:ABC transporter ATP-binding protein (plasmid) [Rhizobium sp. WSM4643]|uniref:ABC transporter ATP-binding protein n=1 Tax=Rhizobium sp. WSM4643 TaxID=3138253 RepID=UPI0021A49480|nr:ABC transporter ATP-binding protein [Rhizobium leguminosarum]UWM78763.1 ABC transporter ATP-binding protein [Rhizobium leguminosarum bv. viciae]